MRLGIYTGLSSSTPEVSGDAVRESGEIKKPYELTMGKIGR